MYTGDGKGKTSAALGIGLRAASAGMKVCMFQFLKKRGSTAEHVLGLDNMQIFCFNEIHPMFKRPSDMQRTRRGLPAIVARDLKKAERIMRNGNFDVIILDEILNCVSEKFIDEEAVMRVLDIKPEHVELVLTGRGASKRLIGRADYVTRLVKVKHPFEKGLCARHGIEY